MQTCRFVVRVLGTALLALVLHVALGWAWTFGAGLASGFFAPRRGGLVGGLGVALDWTAWIGYSYGAAGSATAVMTGTMGGILGNTTGAVVVAATVFIGALLGGVGGLTGTFARRTVRPA